MATNLPYQDDPQAFSDWLYARLAIIPDLTFERNPETARLPIHTSYDDWNLWGALTRSASSTESQSTPTGRTRPSLIRLASKDAKQKVTEKIQRNIIARVSHNGLRLERQYQVIKALSEFDPLGERHIRALELLRLPPRDGHDEVPLLVLLLEDSSGPNNLRKFFNYGPGWYFSTNLPSVKLYDRTTTSDGMARTGNVSLDNFLKFARGATECCILIHDRSMLHLEIRPDALHFDDKTGTVRWINHSAGLRGLEHGLTGAAWTILAKSHGINFKLQFLAPEQTGRLSSVPDNRTDLYSLGILFYLMLTGDLPFAGENPLDVLQNVLSRRVPQVSSKRLDLPQAISAVVSKLVQRNIEDRYHSAHGLLWDLDRIAKIHHDCLESGDCSSLESFEPATQDANCVFRVPDLQVGRVRERTQLLHALNEARQRQQRVRSRVAHKAAFQGQQSINGISVQPPSMNSESDSDGASERSRSISSMGPGDLRRQNESPSSKGRASLSGDQNGTLDETASSGPHRLERALSIDAASSVAAGQPLNLPPVLDGSSLSSRGPDKSIRHSKTDVINVVGAAGLGKSKLVTSVLSEARKYGYVSSSRFDSATSSPFQPMVSLMSSLFRQIMMVDRVGNDVIKRDLQQFVQPVWPILSQMLSLPVDLFSSFSDRNVPTSGNANAIPDRVSPNPHSRPADMSTCRLGSNMERCQKATGFLRTGASSKSTRFQVFFISILRFVCRSSSITFILEDLEAADSESLELIMSIIQSRTPVCLVFTCRGLKHVSVAINSIMTHKSASTAKIELTPLNEEAVGTIVSQTLHRSDGYCSLLTAFALQKSEGNPFALRTFLEDSYKKKYIWYDWSDACWKYDLEKILSHFVSPGVHVNHDFILEQLSELPLSSRQILSWAALLRSPFNFPLVKALIQEHSASPQKPASHQAPNPSLARASSQDIVRGLETLLYSSILVPTDWDDQFEFCHPRWRSASKKLPECSHKAQLHFQITEKLLSLQNSDEDVFALAIHICASAKMIKRKIHARQRYRGILVAAASRLTESQSVESRLQYLSNALALLQDSPWGDGEDSSYSESLLLHIQTAEAYSRTEYIDLARNLLDITIFQSRTIFDKVPSYILLSRIQVKKGQMLEAFGTIREALAHFGYTFSDIDWPAWDQRFQDMRPELDELTIDGLDNRPVNEDPTVAAISELFSEGLSLAFWCDVKQYYLMSLLFLDVTLHRGMTAHSTQSLANIASCVISRFNLVELGVKLGLIGDRLFIRFEDDDYATGKGLGYATMQVAWFYEPIKSLVAKYDTAMEKSLAANDRNNALMNAAFGFTARLWSSYDAADLKTFALYVKELIDWEEDLRGGILLTASIQYARALLGKTRTAEPDFVLCDQAHDSRLYLDWACAHSSTPQRILTNYAQFNLPVLYLFGHYEKAIELAERELIPFREKYWATVSRVASSTMSYVSMAYLAVSPVGAEDEKTRDRVQYAEQTLAQFRIWSRVSDVNLLPWSNLLQAMLLERKNQFGEALLYYESAIDHAEVHSQTFEYALVSEHYAEFLIRRKGTRLARNAMRDAKAAYRRISYLGKTKQIDMKHSYLLCGTFSLNVADAGCQTDFNIHAKVPSKQTMDHPSIDAATAPVIKNREPPQGCTTEDSALPELGLDILDISNILQSSQALAGTLNIDQLLGQMADIMLTSSGADLAAIVVCGDNDWIVAAVRDTSGKVFPANEPLDGVKDHVGKQITTYTLRFRECVYVENVFDDQRFVDVAETYKHKYPEGRSVFCSPIIHQDHLLGCVYVENAPNSFNSRSLTVLKSLLNSVGISIANANLFKKLEKSDASNKALIESQRQAITQARESEHEAKEAREEALENLKLKEEAAKAKSLFLANTSHELRTPLNGVIGMSELLKGSTLSTEQAGYAESIRVCADTLLQVINDILDYSKLEAGKLQLYSIPLFLNETIAEVVRALSYNNQGKNVKSITEIEIDPLLSVLGDPVRIHQLLMNLLSNAYKFTSEGSIIVNAVIEEDTATDVEVLISVSDTGIGIDQSAKRKLFMPFAQADSSTSRSFGGTGLGLSICKAIVETMGGTIWLDSEKGVGTTVSFRLRLAKGSQNQGSTGDIPQANPMKVFTPDGEHQDRKLGGPMNDLSMYPPDLIRIAIAEDNAVNQKIAIRFVQKLGYPCEAYPDGQKTVEALEKAANEGKPFMIVLMDCQMPVLDGYDATRKIRQHPDPLVHDCVIIAMTASAIRGDREKCLEAGMSNYLAKPIKQEMLRHMLDNYIKPRALSSKPASETNGSPNMEVADETRPTSAPRVLSSRSNK